MFALIAPLFSFLSGIAPAISSYFTAAKNVEMAEYADLTEAQREVYQAYIQATIATNAAKVQNNTSRAAHIMIYAFGLPAALHWGAVFVTATLPLGIAIDALHGQYADAEKQIALSFFVLAPAMGIISSFRK